MLIVMPRLSMAADIIGIPGTISDSFESYTSEFALYSATFDQGLVHRVVEDRGIYNLKPVTGSACLS
jgi:hypothetical protein